MSSNLVSLDLSDNIFQDDIDDIDLELFDYDKFIDALNVKDSTNDNGEISIEDTSFGRHSFSLSPVEEILSAISDNGLLCKSNDSSFDQDKALASDQPAKSYGGDSGDADYSNDSYDLEDPDSSRTTPPKDDSVSNEDDEEIFGIFNNGEQLYSSNEILDQKQESDENEEKDNIEELNSDSFSPPSSPFANIYSEFVNGNAEKAENVKIKKTSLSCLSTKKEVEIDLHKNGYDEHFPELKQQVTLFNGSPILTLQAKPAPFSFLPLKSFKLHTVSETCKSLFGNVLKNGGVTMETKEENVEQINLSTRPFTPEDILFKNEIFPAPVVRGNKILVENSSDLNIELTKQPLHESESEFTFVVQQNAHLKALAEPCNVKVCARSKIPQAAKRLIRLLTDDPFVSVLLNF